MLAPTSSKREEEATNNNGSRLVTLTKYVETGSDIGQLVEAELVGRSIGMETIIAAME